MTSKNGITWLKDPVKDIICPQNHDGVTKAGGILCKSYCRVYGPCGDLCQDLCDVRVLPK